MKEKVSTTLIALCLGFAAMAADFGSTSSSANSKELLADLCSVSVTSTVICPNGAEMINAYGTIVYWCDSYVIRHDLSSYSEVSYEEACAGNMFLFA